MPDPGPHGIDVEGAIIDADLLVKYRLVNRAIESLQEAIKAAPRHVGLREKLREIFIDSNRLGDAAQMCMDLSSLYQADYVDATYGGLEGIRRHYDRVMGLDPAKSDNAGRVQRVVAFAEAHFGMAAPLSILDVGSGLGVFLAKEILRLHHGEIHAGPGMEGTEILISLRSL